MPSLAIVVAVSFAVGSFGSWKAEKTAMRAAATYHRPVEIVEKLTNLLFDDSYAYFQAWALELGHLKYDPLPQAKELQKTLEVLVSDKHILGSSRLKLQSAIEELKKFSTSKVNKERIGSLDSVRSNVYEAIAIEAEGIKEFAGFRELGNALDTVFSSYIDVTVRRVHAAIDAPPAIKDLQLYIEGRIASGTQKPTPQRNLDDLLKETTSDASLRAQFGKAIGDKSVAAFTEDVAWDLSIGQRRSSHAEFDEMTTSAQATISRLKAIVPWEAQRIADKFAKRQNNMKKQVLTKGLLLLLSLLGSGLSLLWLFVRINSHMKVMRMLTEQDHLTKTLNRVGLRSATEPWFCDRASGPIGLAVIDLDRFKAVNDTYGHQFGDHVLQAVASAIRNTTIADRTAVSRWGGDEFVVALRFPNGIHDSEFTNVLERIRAVIAEPVEIAGTVLSQTVTVGAALCACGACDIDDLFRAADHALYAGKFEGRNRSTAVDCSFSIADVLRQNSASNRNTVV